MKHATHLALIACLAALLAGCGTEAVYTEESFATDSPFKLKVDEAVAVACESARRSLLGQGYLIDTSAAEQVKGRKAYRSADNLNTFIEMNVVCVPDRKGSTLYANGVLSTYDLKKSGNSASVGISAVGSISLPFGQSADSLVKIAEETIEDKAFYGRFFAAVGHVLKEMETRPEEPAATAEKPAPATGKPEPEADIPLEQGPVAPPAIIAPEQGPATTPAIAPESGPAQPAAAGSTPPGNLPSTPGVAAGAAATTPAAPAAVQGFSVSVPQALPQAQPAPQPGAAAAPAGAAPAASAPATGAPAPVTATPTAAPQPAPATANPPAATAPGQTTPAPVPQQPAATTEPPSNTPAAPATSEPAPAAAMAPPA